jgi:hypothetical protein
VLGVIQSLVWLCSANLQKAQIISPYWLKSKFSEMSFHIEHLFMISNIYEVTSTILLTSLMHAD